MHLFCYVYHGGVTGKTLFSGTVKRLYPDAIQVIAYYHPNGTLEISAPKVMPEYLATLEVQDEPRVLNSEADYWHLVCWIKNKYALPQERVIAYIESNISDIGKPLLHAKAIAHVNEIEPGSVVFFSATLGSRMQARNWITMNGYLPHPKLISPNFAETEKSLRLSSSSNEDAVVHPVLGPLTIAVAPNFAVLNKDTCNLSIKHIGIPAVVQDKPPVVVQDELPAVVAKDEPRVVAEDEQLSDLAQDEMHIVAQGAQDKLALLELPKKKSMFQRFFWCCMSNDAKYRLARNTSTPNLTPTTVPEL